MRITLSKIKSSTQLSLKLTPAELKNNNWKKLYPELVPILGSMDLTREVVIPRDLPENSSVGMPHILAALYTSLNHDCHKHELIIKQGFLRRVTATNITGFISYAFRKNHNFFAPVQFANFKEILKDRNEKLLESNVTGLNTFARQKFLGQQYNNSFKAINNKIEVLSNQYNGLLNNCHEEIDKVDSSNAPELLSHYERSKQFMDHFQAECQGLKQISTEYIGDAHLLEEGSKAEIEANDRTIQDKLSQHKKTFIATSSQVMGSEYKSKSSLLPSLASLISSMAKLFSSCAKTEVEVKASAPSPASPISSD